MAATKTNPAGKAPKSGKGAAKKVTSTTGPSGKADSVDESKPRGRKRHLWWWLIPLIAVGAAAWFGYDFLADLPSKVDALEDRIEAVEELERRLEELEQRRVEAAALQAADARAARLAAERVREALEVRLAAAERGLEALGSQPAGRQVRWRLDAADRLLSLADRQNRFARDYEGAALAVRETLQLLAQIGDPRYGALRAELQEQARALERMPARDIQGVVVRLGALVSRVEGLKPNLKPVAPDSASAGDLPDRGWARAVASTRRAMRSLITVRRTEGDIDTLLTDADMEMLQRLLAAELHLARLAYIQGDLQAYSAALVSARGRLSRIYAPADADVSDTLADIDELLELAEAGDSPDLAASLQRLRNIRPD